VPEFNGPEKISQPALTITSSVPLTVETYCTGEIYARVSVQSGQQVPALSDFGAGPLMEASDALLTELFQLLCAPGRRPAVPLSEEVTMLIRALDSCAIPPVRTLQGASAPTARVPDMAHGLIQGSVQGNARCRCGRFAISMHNLTSPLPAIVWPRLARGKPLLVRISAPKICLLQLHYSTHDADASFT
jgi:hypothetical protein